MSWFAALDPRPFRIARYPATLIERWSLHDGREVTVRPVLPQDAPLTQAFVRALSPDSRYRRFHMGMGELPQRVLEGEVLADNARMLGLLRSMGAAFGPAPGDARVLVARLDTAQAWPQVPAKPLRNAVGPGTALPRADAAARGARTEDARGTPLPTRVPAHLER